MRIGVVQFPGSNCERETMLAILRAGMEPVEFLWNGPLEVLRALDGYVIVGGFSYEDRSRAGIIAALDPVMQALCEESEKGKPILGICNGAQILVETGLVPGIENNKVGMALTENKREVAGKILGTGYYNDWVHIRLADNYQRNAFTRCLASTDILRVPVAHAEGRFVMGPALLEEVISQGLNIFQYCNEAGEIDAAFPINPNGSIANIAGIANKAGNVLALMPHPERTTVGDPLFQSMRETISIQKAAALPVAKLAPLFYYPRPVKRQSYQKHYQKSESLFTCIVELLITDNQAVTVQNTLQQLGLPVQVKRYVHWTIDCDDEAVYQAILNSDVLYNARKERQTVPQQIANSVLVIPKEDYVGKQKQQTLQDSFGITGIKNIRYGVLWQFYAENGSAVQADAILNTNIIHNPYAHDCYDYDDHTQ